MARVDGVPQDNAIQRSRCGEAESSADLAQDGQRHVISPHHPAARSAILMSVTASAHDVKRALLLIWTDIPADKETEFNDWYNREHLRERVEVPGFIRGRRFSAISAAPKYLALCEARSAEVMRSEAYLRLKRTRDARSMQFVPLFRNTIKATCDIVSHAGAGEGAFLVLLPITVDSRRRGAFHDWFSKTFFGELVQSMGVM